MVKKRSNYLIILIFITVLGCISLSIFCISEKKRSAELEQTLEIERKNNIIYKDFISIPIDIFEDRVSSGQLMLVYIGNNECSDCSVFYPTFLKMFREHNLVDKIVYVEGVHLRKDKEKWTEFKKKYGFNQTPTIAIYQYGKQVSSIEWSEIEGISEQDFEKWLDTNKSIIESISIL